MKAAITDANIFIDLFKIGLLERLPRIGDYELETTLLVLNELNEKQQAVVKEMIENRLLHLVEVAQDDAFRLETESVFSEADRSVMAWALQNRSMVLSSDQPVVRFCRKKGLEAHGILWVLEQLFENQALDNAAVLEKLDLLEKANRWLSRSLIEEKRKLWI